MRHLFLAIPDKHVGPGAHCQLDQSAVLPACILECHCQGRTIDERYPKSRAAGGVRAKVVLIGVMGCSFTVDSDEKNDIHTINGSHDTDGYADKIRRNARRQLLRLCEL